LNRLTIFMHNHDCVHLFTTNVNLISYFPLSLYTIINMSLSLLAFLLINAKTVLYLLTENKSILDKDNLRNYRAIIPHLSFLWKLTERLVKSRLIYLRTTSSILSSLPKSNIILLKLHFSPFMTTSLKLWFITTSIFHCSWLICCFLHYKSFYSSWASFILVWHFFY